MPTIAPATAVISIAHGSASQNGNPSFVETTAEEYAPIAIRAIWPTVTWPAKPLTMLSPTARMMLTAITLTTNCV